MATNPNYTEVINATHEQLFRLAVFVTVNPRAATRLLTRAATLARDDAAPETALLRHLSAKRRDKGRWQPAQAELTRANLNAKQAQALLTLLARRAPSDRLALGLRYLRGLSSDEISTLIERPSDELTRIFRTFRADAASALGLVPGDADQGILHQLDHWLDGELDDDEANALRGMVFADAETRALRDGLLTTRALLPQVLTGLFAVAAPATLLPSLQRAATMVQPRRRQRRQSVQQRSALAALVGGVLAVAALIIVLPSLLPRATVTSAVPSASAIIGGAIRRFEQPAHTDGVLHERYRVETAQGPAIIERWYDYAAPHALAVEVRDPNNQAVRFAVRSNGQGKIGYQVAQRYSSEAPNASRRIDYQLAPEAAQAALPTLRSVLMPISLYGNQRAQPEISSLYLAQASANQPVLLGRSSIVGRDAYLLRYSTNQLPTEDTPGRLRQVLLSFDAELGALLDVKVVESSGGESVAYHPWQVEQIDVLDQVPATQFAFDTAAAEQVTGPRSITMPSIPGRLFTTLDDARQTTSQPLLLPTTLPESMRGLVLNRRASTPPDGFTLLYEGEFRSILLTQGNIIPGDNIRWRSGEETIGAYRYRIAESFGAFRNSALAEVYQADTPNERVSVLLIDAYSAPAAREAQLRAVVASLTPLTDANIGTFEQQMVPSAAGS